MRGFIEVNKTITILFWLCLLFFTGKGHGQSFMSAYEEIIEASPAQDQVSFISKLIDRAVATDSIQSAIDVAHKYSIKKYKSKEYPNAIQFGLREIELFEQLERFDASYIQVMYNVGRFYSKNQQYEASIQLHQKIVNHNFSEGTVGRSYCEIGVNYFAMGDYFKGVDNYKIGIQHLEKSDRQSLLIRNYLNLSNRYELINTPEALSAKLTILERMTALDKEVPFRYDMKAALYNSYASYYNNDHIFDFELSKSYQRKFLDLALSEEDSVRAAKSYANFGNLYMEVKNDSALYFFQKALDFYEDEEDVIRTYNNLAQYELRSGHWQKALEKAQYTFTKVAEQNIPLDSVPPAETLAPISDKFSILTALIYKQVAYLKLYEETKEESYLQHAMRHLHTADGLIDFLQLESADEDSKLYWRNEATTIYSLGMLTAFYAERNDLAFYYNEKKKALLLTEAITNNAQKVAVPARLLEEELLLKREVLALEQRYQELKDTIQRNQMDRQIFEAKNQLIAFTDSIQKEYPSYRTNTKKIAIKSLVEVQKNLDPEDALLSYSWDQPYEGLSALFVMMISTKDASIIRLENEEIMAMRLEQYNADIRRPIETKTELEQFKENANALYHQLIPISNFEEVIRDKQLIIVPDGPLQHIPFEALVTKREPLSYLIQNAPISYAYSMSFLMQNRKVTRAATKSLIAYAPQTFENRNLPKLARTTFEINAVQEYYGGEARMRHEATKSDFMARANDYKVLHLATHADAGKFPWIAFQDSTLETYELYTMKQQAEMVVLSACNSAAGELATGEGVFSIARAFFYSGANSVVSSFWNVNDKAAVTIMKHFYEGIADGKLKSHALQKSKLAYLDAHSLSEASPYYWASFIVIGDDSALTSSTSMTTIGWIVGALFLVAILFFFFGRNRILN